VEQMSEYMAFRIMEAFDESGLESAQAKYRAYFINTKLYLKYKPDCDTILTTDGYAQCIVTA
jgi:hypothetical protein